MAADCLQQEVSSGILRLTLNRPEKRNALNAELVAALTSALVAAGERGDVRVVSLSGVGKDFSAGADLAELGSLLDRGATENLADADRLADLFLAIRHLPVPVVARVHGRALAGGCGLATCCDFVLATASAEFGYPEVHIGFIPAMVMAILRRNVPERKALELITMGNRIDALEAADLGLVNAVFADGSFETEAGRFETELASRSRSAVGLAKRLLYHQDGMSYEAAVRAGADLNALARHTDDAREGIRRFLERSDKGSS